MVFPADPKRFYSPAHCLLAVLLLVVACSRSTGSEPRTEPVVASASTVAASVPTSTASPVPWHSASAVASEVATTSTRPARAAALNHAVMLAIADQRTPLSYFVDARAGMVLIDDSASPREGWKPRPSKLLCGAALTREIETWQDSLSSRRTGIRATYGEERLSCQDNAEPTCSIRGQSEYDPSVDFLFRRDDAGALWLSGIHMIDELLVDPVKVAEKRRRAREKMAALLKPGCP